METRGGRGPLVAPGGGQGCGPLGGGSVRVFPSPSLTPGRPRAADKSGLGSQLCLRPTLDKPDLPWGHPRKDSSPWGTEEGAAGASVLLELFVLES